MLVVIIVLGAAIFTGLVYLVTKNRIVKVLFYGIVALIILYWLFLYTLITNVA